MAKIIPDELRDMSADDLRGKVDALEEYIRYMREQITFWADTHDRQEAQKFTQIEQQIADLQE